MATNDQPDIRNLTITELAFGGDGLARDGDQNVFIPYGLPGDTVRARVTEDKGHQVWAKILDVTNPSPVRITPPCVHTFDCGGCALQHMRLDAYQAWKQQCVLDRLERAGLHPATLHPMVAVNPKTRRRATFCARREKGRVIIGFNRHHSDQVIDLRECHVVIDDILVTLPALRQLMDALLDSVREADVSITRLDTGLDILITAPIELNLLMREALAEFANSHNVARITLRPHDRAEGEVVLQPQPAHLSVGGVTIEPAPGSFLQPSIDGERALIAAVQAGVGNAKNIADLFSGLGTFTFPLARHARVQAVDADGPGIRAMARAIGNLPITHQARNLYKEPIRAIDLAKFDAIVFDPPRAGAKAQAPMIAASNVPRIVAVSCNPATFVTDCAPLLESGYKFTDLTVVDQFVWSSHVEIVGVFAK